MLEQAFHQYESWLKQNPNLMQPASFTTLQGLIASIHINSNSWISSDIAYQTLASALRLAKSGNASNVIARDLVSQLSISPLLFQSIAIIYLQGDSNAFQTEFLTHLVGASNPDLQNIIRSTVGFLGRPSSLLNWQQDILSKIFQSMAIRLTSTYGDLWSTLLCSGRGSRDRTVNNLRQWLSSNGAHVKSLLENVVFNFVISSLQTFANSVLNSVRSVCIQLHNTTALEGNALQSLLPPHIRYEDVVSGSFFSVVRHVQMVSAFPLPPTQQVV